MREKKKINGEKKTKLSISLWRLRRHQTADPSGVPPPRPGLGVRAKNQTVTLVGGDIHSGPTPGRWDGTTT